MTINRRQRWSFVILLVALAALALDKLLLSSAPASALGAVSALPAADTGQTPQNRTAELNRTDDRVQRILSRRANEPARSDRAFAWTPPHVETAGPDVFDWSRITRATGTSATGGSTPHDTARRVSAKSFETAHRLKATLLGPRPMALVDGQTYRVGDHLDGLLLKRVQAGRAQFVSDDVTVWLVVPKPWANVESAGP